MRSRGETQQGQTPPLARSSAEAQLEAFRKAFDTDPKTRNDFRTRVPSSSMQTAQNTAADAARGISRANQVHSLGDNVRTGAVHKKLMKERDYQKFRTQGWLDGGMNREQFRIKYGHIPGAIEAYNEGAKEAEMSSTERSKKWKGLENKKK